MVKRALWTIIGVILISGAAKAEGDLNGLYERIKADVAAGKPLGVFVVVPLADHENQGIVSPNKLSMVKGDDPGNNLYWGLMYGMKGYFVRDKSWKVSKLQNEIGGVVLDALEISKSFPVPSGWKDKVNSKSFTMRIRAVAYRGDAMRQSLERYFGEVKKAEHHIIGFTGHNGFMDSDWRPLTFSAEKPVGAFSLACISRDDFVPLLRHKNIYPLVFTNGLMAPEAYTVDGILTSISKGESREQIIKAAAAMYDKYQKCGLNAARRLFKKH